MKLKTGQAERQAINTMIQGSAADIAKNAMVLVERNFANETIKPVPRLVLHLHDELLYEVPSVHVRKAALILKRAMEQSVKLSISFPVKLKSGLSWGEMVEL